MVGSASGPGSTFKAFLGSTRVRVPLSNKIWVRVGSAQHIYGSLWVRIFGPVKTSNSRYSSIRHSGVTVRYGGNWLRRNVGNISVLNHEGEPVDITTQATCKLCSRVMPVNVLISVNSLYAESESKNGMTELSASDTAYSLRRRETNQLQHMLITVYS